MSSEQRGKLKNLQITSIKESPVALRSVNRKSEDYLHLVDSIKNRGILNPILVREVKDPESGQTIYGLIDGLHRFSAAHDAGLETIPALVQNMDDADVLEAQIITNAQKIETKPAEYSQQLLRILAGNPTLTMSELAKKLSRSVAWLQERLKLNNLIDSIKKLVDDEKITLSNAQALAKLPQEEQANYVDRAISMTPQEFTPAVNARVKELRDAKRQGRDATPAGFTPVPHAQKLAAVKEEHENHEIGKTLISQTGVKTAEEGFNLAIAWILHLDPLSIEEQKRKYDERKAAEAEAREKRKADREAQKAKQAAEAAASV